MACFTSNLNVRYGCMYFEFHSLSFQCIQYFCIPVFAMDLIMLRSSSLPLPLVQLQVSGTSAFDKIPFSSKLSLSNNAILIYLLLRDVFSSMCIISVITPRPFQTLFLMFFQFFQSAEIISPKQVTSLTWPILVPRTFNLVQVWFGL